MNTFTRDATLDDGSTVRVSIHHYGSYNGDAVIEVGEAGSNAPSHEVRVPCEVLVAFTRSAQLDHITDLLEDLER